MKMKRLNEYYPNWKIGDGIFSDLQSFNVPWGTDDINKELDIEYFGNISGEKIVSPLVRKICSGDYLTPLDRIAIVKTVVALYLSNWGKLYNTMVIEYNPIENYRMTETLELTDTNTHGLTITRNENTDTDYTDLNTPNLTVNHHNNINGFNSSNSVPSDNSVDSTTGTNTNTHNERVDGTETTTHSGDDILTREHELIRSGNIGVTTSQQMIESERKLRMWNFFQTVVFPDLNRVLTIQTY